MADYFDTLRGTTPALLSEEERKRLGLLSQVMGSIPTMASPEDPAKQQMMQQAGFIPRPGAPGADGQPAPGTFVTPERMIAEQQASLMEEQIGEIQRRYDEQRTSAMFRLGDGLADAGRLFLSPLLFLAGEDFNDYDPSAKLRAGYRRELQGLVQTQNEALTNLISARDRREETYRELQEDAAKLGPFGGMGENMNSWAYRTLYGPGRDPSSDEYRAAYQYVQGATTSIDPASGKPYSIQKSADPTVVPPTALANMPGFGEMQAKPPAPPTEGQANAGGFASRMLPAIENMSALEDAGYRPSVLEWNLFKWNPDSFYALNANNQDAVRYFRNLESYVRAKLRRESGAAISAQEFDQEGRNAALLPGMGEEVLGDIRRERIESVRGMFKASGYEMANDPETMARIAAYEQAYLNAGMSGDEAKKAAEDSVKTEDEDTVEIPDELLLPGGGN